MFAITFCAIYYTLKVLPIRFIVRFHASLGLAQTQAQVHTIWAWLGLSQYAPRVPKFHPIKITIGPKINSMQTGPTG